MFFNLGMQEMLIVGMVAVLLFGKRLPEVARSLGGSYREFRKGLAEMQAHMHIDDTSSSVRSSSSSSSYYAEDVDDYEQPTAPKFEPPTSEPTVASAAASASASEEDAEPKPTAEQAPAQTASPEQASSAEQV